MSGTTAAELHSRAVAESARGRHATARRLLLAALRQRPEAVSRAQILLSLAYHAAERSSLAAGLALLDEADEVPDLPGRVRGLVASQRGLLYLRAGQSAEALAGLDAALRLLDESAPEGVCRALLNRSHVHLRLRDLPRARGDLARCVDVASRHRLTVIAAKASHNLGYLLLLSGDLPGALRQMDAVAPTLGGLSPAMAAVYYVDRAQVLLAAGLFREADDDLAHAVDLLGGTRIQQDRAEAELARAQVALVEERWADARRLARQAGHRFTRRGAQVWTLLAEQVRIAATVGSGRGLAGAAEAGGRLAAELAAAGLADEARRAALTAALAALGALGTPGRPGLGTAARPGPNGAVPDATGAARALAGDAVVLRRDDPIATRLQARLVRARLADADGRPDRADTELRAALEDLHRYQSSFGSLDLQTAVSGHGRRLAEQGLARALASGHPAAVFGWAERARALSARLSPVVPPADPEAARLLEELRHARVELHAQTLARKVDPAVRARCAHLERLVRQRAWYRPGPGQAAAPVPLGRVQESLAAHDATLVAHVRSDGRVYALTAGRRRRAVLDLGPAAPVVELHRRLRADLDVLAARNVPPPIRAAVRTACASGLRRLDDALWAPLRRLLADGPLLLAPAAALATVPWTMLSTVDGRPTSVVSSVTAWLAARGRAALPAHPTVAFAVGPRVPRAADELRLVSRQWPAVAALSGADATAAAVRSAAGTVDVLHVAAHGVHEPDNPLFSHLELADGPLFGHELDQLPRLPTHVVLSACELGLAGTRAGDETLGMTAALLHGGARSVVAGVARIADTAACRIGAAHHAGLRRGLPPAAALAAALRTEAGDEPAPLVCFGTGW